MRTRCPGPSTSMSPPRITRSSADKLLSLQVAVGRTSADRLAPVARQPHSMATNVSAALQGRQPREGRAEPHADEAEQVAANDVRARADPFAILRERQRFPGVAAE